MIASIVIAGGGTGGHVYPGIAIAEEIARRNPAARIAFIGTVRGLEAKILGPLGYALWTISASRLKGGGLASKLKGLFRLPLGIFQSCRVLRRMKPEVVVGVGGYASGPALLAAWLTCYKTAIHEQNATPGLTNRWLGKLVERVFVGFAAATRHFGKKKTFVTGNPIRRAIAMTLRAAAQKDARRTSGGLRVLVFGGSQGATFLNERVPELLAGLARRGLALTVTHQTGMAEVAATQGRYAGLALAAEVVPYVDDMAQAYAEADLAICRAGALTIAELTAVGLPSLLVPFPFAADNHQEANARVLEAAGAAIVCAQRDWDRALLTDTLASLATDPTRLERMSAAARALACVDAASLIVDNLEALA